MQAATPRPARPGSAKQVVFITLACACVLGTFYALSQLGPDSYSVGSRRPPVSREQEEKLRTAAESAEERWIALKRLRASTKTAFTDEDLRVIGEAAVARMQYENAVEVPAQTYPALRKELHDRSGERLRAESVRLENLAVAEARAGRHPAAEALFKQAGEVENRLVSDFPESSFKNMQRMVYLDSQMRLMQAKPLWERCQSAEKDADTAYAKGALPQAIAAMEAAREASYRLERSFRGLTPADSFHTRNLERRLSTLKSITLRDRALATLSRADKAVADRAFDDLPTLRKEVEDTVRELAEKYPDSEHAAPAALADLVRRAQNAASAPDAESVERELLALDTAIRKGDPASHAMIESLGRSVQRVRSLYPESDRIGQETGERVEFLFRHRTEVALLSASVDAALRPIPGRPGLRILQTETPQRLYSLVMGDNPSADQGDLRPVESLTRAEALLFCKRLGWLIARPVRLPDEGEFRALVGTPAASTLATLARSIDNSNGIPAPVPAAKPDAADLADLLGNVAEWLAPAPGAKPAEALVAGGSAESTLVELARVPLTRRASSERSRFVGFRFIVEQPTAPTAR